MLYESQSNDIQIALTGDSQITRTMSQYREERFLEVANILRESDVAFTNAEMLFHDYESSPNTVPGGGSPHGTYMRSHPRMIKELQWLGFDMVSCANNHSADYGEGGVLAHIKNLDEAGMPHAGTGRTMTEARAPAYFDSPKGRVALIAAADWGVRGKGGFPCPSPMGVMAGEQSPYSIGRPGCNLIRHRAIFTVEKEAFDALRKLSKNLKFEQEKASRHYSPWGGEETDKDSDTVFHFMDSKFVLGNTYSMTTIPHPGDMQENLKWVKDARRMADWVIVSFHSHGASNSPEEPCEHSKAFAHACIDAGADVFIGQGPHRDQGIEIYKGRPIFHALGNFIFQNGTVQWLPYESMAHIGLPGWNNTPSDWYEGRNRKVGNCDWETAIATASFKGGRLHEIRLNPVDLGMSLPRGQRGRPVLAERGSEVSKRVLGKFQELSKPFGTDVKIKDGVGLIQF